jgi:hypothetical protein
MLNVYTGSTYIEQQDNKEIQESREYHPVVVRHQKGLSHSLSLISTV